MFADTPYANGPFADNPRASNLAISCDIAEAATISEITGAEAAFVSANNETVVGTDSIAASPIFNATLLEASTGSEVTSALVIFSSVIAENSSGLDSVLVAPSTFNAAVVEGSEALASVLASAAFIAAVTEGAVAADQLTRRLLWELIDDSQPVSWQLINTQE